MKCRECGNTDNLCYRDKDKGIYQSICKDCQKEVSRKYYRDNKEKVKVSVYKANERLRIRNQIFVVDYLKNHPCTDCGENDPIVLEFDHIRGQKTNNVSVLIGKSASLKRIQEEIEKCDVRCANCHRRRHNVSWFRTKATSGNLSEEYGKLINNLALKICKVCGAENSTTNFAENRKLCVTCYNDQQRIKMKERYHS